VGRFRSILECERARSDRGGHLFSLVVFDVGNSEADVAGVRHLVHVLTKRIRSIDEAGWLGNQRIGVLLPYTSATGAWKLADDVCQAVATKISPPECTVYTYPSRWFSDSNGHSAQLHFQDISPESETTTSLGFFVFAKHSDGGNIDLDAQRLSANGAPDRGESADAFKSFLLSSPLPTWKRAMDVVGALLGLVLLSPLMLLATVIIKIISPGPAFFKQQRVGYMGETFAMWKFRTMKVDADTSVHQQYLAKLINGAAHNDENSTRPMTKLDDGLEITPFGTILRQTYFDELPQLINVLRGEMSLVGPRPPIPYEVEEYLRWHNGRVDAVPGLTGLWQVSGKNRLTFNEMVRLDIQYWRKKSPWLDIKILLMTPLAIVSQIKDSLQNRQLQMKGFIENA
jgi:lipopolysaccharide/colanic/teichoic acid biosynthesis glycosyltransferase